MQELKNYLAIRDYLKTVFLEREKIIDGILISLLAQENTLLIGPPGTAKSELIMTASKCFVGLNYFQWLLTKFTTPEEIFGALSLKELEQGIYKRNTIGKMPEAHIGFVDEIFKANSAILNSLLTIINERLFYNNGTPMQTPLMSLIGASNEFPEDDEGLEALDDRFMTRFMVDYIKEDSSLLSLLKNKSVAPKISAVPMISGKEVITLQNAAKQVSVSAGVLDTMMLIKTDLAKEGINPSTRRWVKCINIIKATALMDNCNTADTTHLSCLKNVLWLRPEEEKLVAVIVANYCVDRFTSQLENFTNMAKSIKNTAIQAKTANNATEGIAKLKEICNELNQLKGQYPNKQAAIDTLLTNIESYKKEIVHVCMGIDI